MRNCTYCGEPADPDISTGAPVCTGCVDDVLGGIEDGSTTIVVCDDLEGDCPVEPGHREKVLANYDEIIGAFQLPEDSIVLEGAAAAPVTNAVLSLFQCGPSTGPCGPSRDDHTWDDEEAVYDAAGNECGATAKCSKCGLTARDFDLWNSP